MCCLSTGQLVESVNTWDGAFPELLFYSISSGCNSGVECLLPKQNVSRPRHRTRLVGLSWRVAMLKLRTDTQRRLTAEEIFRNLFDMGYSKGDLHELVDATGAQRDTPTNGSAVAEISYPANTVHVYDSVPPHLATVPEIAQEHDVSRQAVYQWIDQGHTPIAGLLSGGAGGQRNVTLLNRRQVAEHARTRSLDESVIQTEQLRVFEELPPHLIDLPSAARQHGRAGGTLHAWVKMGLLRNCGRLTAPVKGGGYIVLDRAEVESVASTRPRRARKQVPY